MGILNKHTEGLHSWLRLLAPHTGDKGSIPGQGTKIPHAAWYGPKKKKISK